MNFDLTFAFMLPLLQWFAAQTHSWGWAIIGLTVLVRILVSPLVTSSTVQMRRTSQVAPQMQKLQAKYKENPELLQQKMMEFYKKNKINPVGGCLPMLVQLPILFALYGAFSGPPFMDKPIDVPVKVVAKADASAAHRDETSKNTAPYVATNGDLSKITIFPGETTVVDGDAIDFSTRATQGKLNGTLNCNWKVFKKGTDPNKVAETAGETFHAAFPGPGEYVVQAKVPGIAKNEPFGPITSLGKISKGMELLNPKNWDVLFLIIGFGLTTYLSSLFSVGGGTNTPESEMTEQQLIQKQTMKMMPITMTVMFCFIPLPAGVFLYFVVSNLFQVIQTWIVMKQPSAPVVSVIDDDEEEGSGGSGGSNVKNSGGPKEGPSGRSKGPSGGKSKDASGDSPATISSSSEPRAIAASTSNGATLNTAENVESSSAQPKSKKKKK